MEIPESVKIGGVVYEIKHEARLNTGVNLAYGHIDYDKALIRIGEGMQEKQGACQTLLHEIIHGIEHHFGIDLTEDVVDKIANGIYMVAIDNPSLFAKTSTVDIGKYLCSAADCNNKG